MPIIGIAKNKFYAVSDDYAVHRGKSKYPLYVTCVYRDDTHDEKKSGFNIQQALTFVQNLEGKHRLPRMITLVDTLSRSSSLPT